MLLEQLLLLQKPKFSSLFLFNFSALQRVYFQDCLASLSLNFHFEAFCLLQYLWGYILKSVSFIEMSCQFGYFWYSNSTFSESRNNHDIQVTYTLLIFYPQCPLGKTCLQFGVTFHSVGDGRSTLLLQRIWNVFYNGIYCRISPKPITRRTFVNVPGMAE